MVGYSLDECHNDGIDVTPINPIVLECNAELLNDSSGRVIGASEVLKVIETAKPDFEEGDVGGEKEMVCYGLKDGIGFAFRLILIDGNYYTIGVLVQTNFGGTANRLVSNENIRNIKVINKDKLAYAIRMVTEEAILTSLACANEVSGEKRIFHSFTDVYLKDFENAFKDEAFIDNLPAVNQFPDYPVGCESVALYQLLKYYNVDVTIENIVEKSKKSKTPYEEDGVLYGGDSEY